MNYRKLSENLKNFKQELNELEAEIVGEQIPYHKMFTIDGKALSKEKLTPEWASAFKEILGAIKKAGMMQKFSPDEGPTDIKPGTKGIFNLYADDGTTYVYNMNTKKIKKGPEGV